MTVGMTKAKKIITDEGDLVYVPMIVTIVDGQQHYVYKKNMDSKLFKKGQSRPVNCRADSKRLYVPNVEVPEVLRGTITSGKLEHFAHFAKLLGHTSQETQLLGVRIAKTYSTISKVISKSKERKTELTKDEVFPEYEHAEHRSNSPDFEFGLS